MRKEDRNLNGDLDTSSKTQIISFNITLFVSQKNSNPYFLLASEVVI